jgi:hypothetical protein
MSTPSPLYRYPLDGTGTSPDNLVVGEEHQLSNRTVRAIAPTYGGFFAESCVVKDLATSQPLIKGTDYYFGELFEFPTGRYGKEIFGVILITKPNVAGVSINYQALGGDYSYSMDAIIAMIDSLNLGDRPVAWGDIIGRPTLFDPATHWHDAGDVYGFEYVVSALIQLRNAILTGDVASHDEIYRYIDTWANQNQQAIDAVSAALAAHVARTDNPHGTTKAQVGLGNVDNYLTATQAQMNTGTATNLFVTPAIVAAYVTAQAVNPLAAHAARTDNPHAVTKAQTGLGNVDNFLTATLAQAQAGVVTNAFMTPYLVAQAITTQAGAALALHVQDHNNPHQVTVAQLNTFDGPTITAKIKVTDDKVVYHTTNNNNTTRNPHGTQAGDVGAVSQADFNNSYWPTLQNQLAGKQPNGNYAVIGSSPSFNVVYANQFWSYGDIVAFNSDRRLKKNVRPIQGALAKLRKIRGVLYRYKVSAIEILQLEDREYMGVIAQEIQAVCPEIVCLAPFDRDPDTGLSISGKNFLTVQYEKLTALLIEAQKEADAIQQEICRRLGYTDLLPLAA